MGPEKIVEKFRALFLKTLKNEDGQGLTEYALIVGVIALVCIAAVSSLGSSVYDAFFSKIQAWLSSVT